MIEAVVFDCDGVLVDSERVNNEVLAELVTCAGLPTTAEDSAARYMGRSTAECLAEIEHQLGRHSTLTSPPSTREKPCAATARVSPLDRLGAEFGGERCGWSGYRPTRPPCTPGSPRESWPSSSPAGYSSIARVSPSASMPAYRPGWRVNTAQPLSSAVNAAEAASARPTMSQVAVSTCQSAGSSVLAAVRRALGEDPNQ
jgi:hypothetical protein